MRPTRLRLLFFALLLLAPAQAADLKVAALHPLLADALTKVGGEHVEVFNVLANGGDVHHFELSASGLARLQQCQAVFASGMGLETYLPKLADSLKGVEIIDVGATLPTIKLDAKALLHDHDHGHGHDDHDHDHDHAKEDPSAEGHLVVDPHWWQSIRNMKRAVRFLGVSLGKLDPAHAEAYRKASAAHRKTLDELEDWARKELSLVPKDRRQLVTAHAAFGYFCEEFDFEPLPLLGLAREEETSPRYVIEAIATIRQKKIAAVFPEDQANPKILDEITRETGVRVGEPLIADGTANGEGATFEGLFRHNVSAIVKALTPAKP